MLKKLIFIFCIFCCVTPVHGLTLKVMRPGSDTPLSIELHATKRTEHALALKTANGTIYYADMTRVGSSWPGDMFARLSDGIYLIGTPPTTPQFFVTTTTGTDGFSFQISAKGYFVVNWGDGDVQQIVRTDTNTATYSHTYSASGKYTIGIGGRATGYTTENMAAISFKDNLNVAAIDGSLGAVFGTIGDGSDAGQQPRFSGTFSGCANVIGAIPDNLFAGIKGTGVSAMFSRLFFHCTGLTKIPENLFANIKGPGQTLQFFDTFNGCLGIKTIPENLFAGVAGPAAEQMFQGTFYLTGITSIPAKLFANITGPGEHAAFAMTFDACKSLGAIPENLFASINGPAATNMFYGTFWHSNAAIPENLFGNLSGPLATETFAHTFADAPKRTGASAKINGRYLYEIWPDATYEQVGGCYEGATGLSDYANIPDAWK